MAPRSLSRRREGSHAALAITIDVDDQGVMAALREEKREIRRDVKDVFLVAANRTAVPAAKRLAPGGPRTRIRENLVARSTTRGAYLTTSSRGWRRRVAGLYEFGGKVRGEIKPGNGARAIPIGPNIFRARVTKPRLYFARRYMQRGVRAALPAFEHHVERELADRMQRRIDAHAARLAA